MSADAFVVTVAGAGISFPCGPEETVLDAADRAGLTLPSSCRKGACLTCEGMLVSGEAQVRGQGRAKGPVEAVRLCQARPRSDIEIAPQRIDRRQAAPHRALQARVHRVLRPAPDVTVLRLRFPNGVRVRFRAGQHLTVMLEGGHTRQYSIANPPQANDGVELHLRHLAGGRFSDTVARLRPGDRLQVELPFGEGAPDPTSRRPLVLAVTGVGFAPARSIIEDLIRRGARRPTHLYWGGRTEGDLYMADAMHGLTERHGWLSFAPVLSRPAPGWIGRTGYVQDAVLQDYPDLRDFEAYACGNPAMTAAVRRVFLAAGLDPARFYCDPFVASGETAA